MSILASVFSSLACCYGPVVNAVRPDVRLDDEKQSKCYGWAGVSLIERKPEAWGMRDWREWSFCRYKLYAGGNFKVGVFFVSNKLVVLISYFRSNILQLLSMFISTQKPCAERTWLSGPYTVSLKEYFPLWSLKDSKIHPHLHLDQYLLRVARQNETPY